MAVAAVPCISGGSTAGPRRARSGPSRCGGPSGGAPAAEGGSRDTCARAAHNAITAICSQQWSPVSAGQSAC
eukprot:scaffold665493_cov97-Prasinocladus_malaysianus.AAC.1